MKRFAAYAVLLTAALITLSATGYAADFEIRLKTISGLSKFVIQDVNSSEVMKIDSAGRLRLKPSTPPPTPSTGEVIIDSTGNENMLRWWNGSAWKFVGTIEVDQVTIGFTGTSIEVKDQAITPAKLRVLAPPAPGQLLAWNQASNSLEWKDASGSGTITGVTPGAGLSGGGTTGTVTLEIKPGGVTSSEIRSGAVTSEALGLLAVTAGKISPEAAVLSIASVDAASRLTGNVNIKAGDNIQITQTGATIEVKGTGGGSGTITGITVGSGLAGGGTSGSVTIEARPDNTTIGTPGAGALQVLDSGITNVKLAPGPYTNISKVGSLESVSVTGEAEFLGPVLIKGKYGIMQSATLDVTALAGITSSMLTNHLLRVKGSGGPVTITNIDPGIDGQFIIIKGTDDNKVVTISPSAVITLSSATAFGLGARDTLMMYYDAAEGVWYELNRNDN